MVSEDRCRRLLNAICEKLGLEINVDHVFSPYKKKFVCLATLHDVFLKPCWCRLYIYDNGDFIDRAITEYELDDPDNYGEKIIESLLGNEIERPHDEARFRFPRTIEELELRLEVEGVSDD